jgi:hypothetical protein
MEWIEQHGWIGWLLYIISIIGVRWLWVVVDLAICWAGKKLVGKSGPALHLPDTAGTVLMVHRNRGVLFSWIITTVAF